MNHHIQFVLCPGKDPEAQHTQVYQQIYESWHQLWSKTYEELENNEVLHSDTFTRQDFIGAILIDGQCQAFILFRHIDLSNKASLKDSYFEQWNELHLKKVSKIGNKVLICGNLGIMPGARKDSLGFHMKDLMMGFITEIALHSKAAIVISTPRKDKNVHGAVYKWGGTLIANDIDWGLGVVVDLTAFIKSEVMKKRDQDIMPLVHKLWSERLVIHEERLESVNSFADDADAIPFTNKKAG